MDVVLLRMLPAAHTAEGYKRKLLTFNQHWSICMLG
jgi:hypothetical protein